MKKDEFLKNQPPIQGLSRFNDENNTWIDRNTQKLYNQRGEFIGYSGEAAPMDESDLLMLSGVGGMARTGAGLVSSGVSALGKTTAKTAVKEIERPIGYAAAKTGSSTAGKVKGTISKRTLGIAIGVAATVPAAIVGISQTIIGKQINRALAGMGIDVADLKLGQEWKAYYEPVYENGKWSFPLPDEESLKNRMLDAGLDINTEIPMQLAMLNQIKEANLRTLEDIDFGEPGIDFPLIPGKTAFQSAEESSAGKYKTKLKEEEERKITIQKTEEERKTEEFAKSPAGIEATPEAQEMHTDLVTLDYLREKRGLRPGASEKKFVAENPNDEFSRLYTSVKTRIGIQENLTRPEYRQGVVSTTKVQPEPTEITSVNMMSTREGVVPVKEKQPSSVETELNPFEAKIIDENPLLTPEQKKRKKEELLRKRRMSIRIGG